MDSAGDSRGISIYLENNTVHYKVSDRLVSVKEKNSNHNADINGLFNGYFQVVTSSKTWDLSTDLVTNDWQDVVLTWKKEEGLMLYVNGAFRDSQKDGTTTSPVPNKQARLTVGRKSGNPPYRYTRWERVLCTCYFVSYITVLKLSINRSTDRSIDQSINQLANQTANQSIN